MHFTSTSHIKHPREKVFLAYRDRLPEIATYIPDIEGIEVKSREEADDVVKLHNVWRSDREIPGAVSKFVKPEDLKWDDFAVWRIETFLCEWRIEPRVFTEAVRCSGTNTFIEEDGGTRIELSGEFTLDLAKIRGIPGFVAKRIAPQIEKFIVSLITPNLERVNASLESFLDEQG